MAANQTENYGLNQWLATDQVVRTDFNADNEKIDAALSDLAEGKADNTALEDLSATVTGLSGTVAGHTAALTHCGNCTIVHGSYTGNGLAGASAPNSLTFAGRPLAVFLMPANRYSSSNSSMMMIRGAVWAQYHPEALATICTVTWSETSVSWYHADGDVQSQFSLSGAVYYYVAFLASEE